MPTLTILTEVLPEPASGICETLKRRVRAVRNHLTASVAGQAHGGHSAVTRSVVQGLTKLGTRFNYNPERLKNVAEVVVVLSGIEALKQAIQWKKSGRVKRLLAGPNLVVRSSEYNGLLTSPEIDICLVPSDWVRVAYEEDAPSLRGRIRVWPAGVDSKYWKPKQRRSEARNVLVYWKTEREEFCDSVERILCSFGWVPIRLAYGRYTKREFKMALSASSFAVFVSRSESQGIALAEAWAMNVPTIVWNPKELVWEGRRYSVVSSCPYLTSATGVEWTTLQELGDILRNVETKLLSFQPRIWVLHNMTDEISARNLLRIAEDSTDRAFSI